MRGREKRRDKRAGSMEKRQRRIKRRVRIKEMKERK